MLFVDKWNFISSWWPRSGYYLGNLKYLIYIPASNGNTRTMCKISSKLAVKTSQWGLSIISRKPLIFRCFSGYRNTFWCFWTSKWQPGSSFSCSKGSILSTLSPYATGFFETGYTIASGFYKKYWFFLKESNRLKTTPHCPEATKDLLCTIFIPCFVLNTLLCSIIHIMFI